MKIRLIIFTFSFALIWSSQSISQSTVYRENIPIDELQKDFEVLKKVLQNYHPGLYRYQDEATIDEHFDKLQLELNRAFSTKEFYLILSRFTAQLKCGHTFCSYYNQNKDIQERIFNLDDKVPFTFSLFEKQMFIDKNLSEENFDDGSQIISINAIPVSLIIDSLLLYSKGDGNNDGKRLIDLELTGFGEYETFDIYFPLLFPPNNSIYDLEIRSKGEKITQKIKVKTIGRAERLDLIEKKYGPQPKTYDDLWKFKVLNEKTALLQLGSFVTDKLTIDWRKFLSNAFDEVKSKNITNLIIDIRGNEGGDDAVNRVLANYLASRPIEFPAFKQLLTYEKVSDELRPYLKTWDKGFYDRTGKLTNLNNGFYTWKKDRSSLVIKQKKKAFDGKLYLLVDAANSSATFFLATALKQNKIATIIGTQTGGNRKGTNGGNLFFLRLPNSKIEIDIPLIGYYPITEQPDEGLKPDIIVERTLEDIRSKKDVVLDKALQIIK